MGVTGRKLTIRMPDNPRLRSAEVGKLHLDPGARVQSGNPVLTLVHRRREHKVRAPRSGRVVPLIAPGDRVAAGDPLYILHLDEAALEIQNREEKALIAVEKEKWTSGVLADAIEPIERARQRTEGFDASEFVANWGKPVLALALYVLACFALLPILHLFGKTASTPILIAMVVGCLAFAGLIYYLYAPDAGKWPRRVVQFVAASWVGISSIALFYQPDSVRNLNVGTATEQIASLFEGAEEPLAPAPAPAPQPATVELAGVAVGPTEIQSAPDLTVPISILTRSDDAVTPHGVTVRAWARVTPGNGAGAVLWYDHMDRFVDAPISPTVILANAEPESFTATGDVTLPAGMADAPKAAERDPEIVMAAIPSLQDTIPGTVPAPDLLLAEQFKLTSLDAFAERVGGAAPAEVNQTLSALGQDNDVALPLERGPFAVVNGSPSGDADRPATRGVDFAVRLSESARYAALVSQPETALSPALNLYSAIQTASTDWLNDQALALAGVPTETGLGPMAENEVSRGGSVELIAEVLGISPANATIAAPELLAEARIGRGLPMPTASPVIDPYALNDASSPVSTAPVPNRVQIARSPDLLLVSALRAGEDVWMQDQRDLLTALGGDLPDGNRGTPDAHAPVILASLESARITSEPIVDALGDLVGQAKLFGMAVLPVPDGDWPSPGDGPDAQPKFEITRLAPPAAAVSPASVNSYGRPAPAPLPPEVQPELRVSERDLLYLYFDDPRILSHPQMGDPWEGLVSPDLAAAIQRTEVVEIHEMLQVQNWCGAANDPDGTKRQELGEEYSTAFLNDRIRLLRVRLSVDETALDLLEREIPLFDGTPAGFFHNKAPMLAGLPQDTLMQRGRDHLRSLSTGLFDPNAPDAIGGGQYFDNAFALSIILQGAGCLEASLNDGAGPSNAIGRMLSERLGG